MPNLDPSDVYPLRNLPGKAEQWGRRVESDQVSIKRAIASLGNSIASLGRSMASSFQMLSKQISGLASAQAELSETTARLNQTNQVIQEWYALNTNTSGWFPETVVTPPSWASYAMVTASFTKDVGSTSREIIIPVYAQILNSPSLGIKNGTVASGFFTGGWWEPYEVTTPIVVELASTEDALHLNAYRNVMVSGSGSIDIAIFYSITWIE